MGCGEPPAMPALPPDAVVTPRTPQPYRLRQWYDDGDGWAAVNDRVELDVHGATSMTHLDTVDHFLWHERGHRDFPPVDAGCTEPVLSDALHTLRNGLIGRGVLVDVPHLNGGPIRPSHVVTLEDVRRSLKAQRTELRPGTRSSSLSAGLDTAVPTCPSTRHLLPG